MSSTIEKTIILDWKEDKDVFDNLQIGDLIERNSTKYEVVCSKGKKTIIACSRFKDNLDFIETSTYEWGGKKTILIDGCYYKKNPEHVNKFIYDALDKILKEVNE